MGMCVLLLLLIKTANYAYASTLKNLHINSSDLFIDREKQIATFKGNVVICFDNIKLLGEESVFYFSNQNMKDIKEIHLYRNIKAVEENDNILLADKAVFIMDKSELKLSGNVIIEKGEKVIFAEEITYFGKISKISLKK